jgi:hypothetical protein
VYIGWLEATVLSIYLPEAKRTSIYVRSTFLASLLPCHLGPAQLNPSATPVFLSPEWISLTRDDIRSASNGNLFNLFISISWDDLEDDGRIVGQVMMFKAAMEQVTQIVWLGNPYIYLDYAAIWQDRIDGYGVIVGKELQKVSEKYDSRRVLEIGGFKFA